MFFYNTNGLSSAILEYVKTVTPGTTAVQTPASTSGLNTDETTSTSSPSTTANSPSSIESKPSLVPVPVQPPTTPTIKPVYTPPKENLFNVRYEETANHYWVFSTDAHWLLDNAPKQNFLSKALFERYDDGSFDFYDATIKADFNQKTKTLFTELVSSKSFVGPASMKEGIFPGDSKCIQLSRSSSMKCFELVSNLKEERPYFRSCIFNPENCEYGLSLSIWINFQSSALTAEQTLISTTPPSDAGFYMGIKSGVLTVKVIGAVHTYTCTAPVSTDVNSWNNFAFRWKATNGDLDVILNKKVLSFCPGWKTETLNGIVKGNAQSIWIGCTAEDDVANEDTAIYDAYISHPALWYWPLELTVLFLGDKTDWFEVPTTESTTPLPVIDQKIDYTKLVEEYQPKNWSGLPLNPYYATADGYFELTSKPNSSAANEVEQVGPNCRGRNSYRLKTGNAYYQLKTLGNAQHPFSISSFPSGFSIGSWVSIPSSLQSSDHPRSLFEIADVIRITLYGDFLHVFVFDGRYWKVTRLVEAIVRDVAFNVGFSIFGNADEKTTGFINGVYTQTMAFAPQKPSNDENHTNIPTGTLILGSKISSRSAAGVEIGDLVYWERSTLKNEGHRFIGYTETQIRLLSEANNHWSTDAYLLHDAPCRIIFERRQNGIMNPDTEISDFKLASLYKPLGIQPIRYILDQEEKSIAPVLSMRKSDYLMLGKRWKSQPSQVDLQWFDHCLHDPSLSSCSSQGATLSVWFSLQSVSESRTRYIFNSGDAGDSDVSAVMDGRGWAIFTQGSLIGASISLGTDDWKLILDSTIYNLDQWMNLGVTWSISQGLRLFINGMDLSAHSTHPKTRYKEYIAPAYLLIGRFDTDNSSNWLTPAEAAVASSNPLNSGIPAFWEMAHFAFSEMTYINRYMTAQEYAHTFGFIGNVLLEKKSKRLWFGSKLLDPSASDLLLASKIKVPMQFGAHAIYNSSTFDVEYDDKSRAVILGLYTVLRFGPLDPDGCPGKLKHCKDGFTVGGWYALISGTDGMLHTNFTSPVILLLGNGGEFGIALDDGGHHLVGWVKGIACQGSSSILTEASRHNQWFHVGLSWFNEKVFFFFNGNLLSTCADNTVYQEKGKKTYAETQTNGAFLLVTAPPRTDVGYRLAVSIVNIWETYVDSWMGFADFMGLTNTEMTHFSKASFYWPMNGLLTNLAPSRLLTYNVVRTKDSRNIEGAAICTTDSKQSYVVLTGDYRPRGNHSNLYYSCLYDIAHCSKIIFMLDFLLKEDSVAEDREITLLNSPTEDDTVGISITVNLAQATLTVVHRSSKMQCISVANLSEITDTENGWISLQAFITEKSVSLRMNDRDLRSLSQTPCKVVQSNQLKYDSSPFPIIIIGQKLSVCVSNVAIIESTGQADPHPPSIMETCYVGADILLPLVGKHPNQQGKLDMATDLSSITKGQTSNKLSNCFNNLMQSCSKFTFSFWAIIKRADMKDSTRYLILSTGPDTYQGISISAEFSTPSGYYNLIVKLVLLDSIYQIFANNFAKTDEWVNIGVVATASDVSTGVIMEVYRNGHSLISTSLPILKSISAFYLNNPSPGIYFGSSIATIVNMNGAYIASGAVNMFAFWLDRVASCGTPRSSFKRLMGMCAANDTLPEVISCQTALKCQFSTNGVCFDNSVENIYAMAKGSHLISSPMALLSLLKVLDDILANKPFSHSSEDEKRLLWSGVVLFNRLVAVEQASTFETENLKLVAEKTLKLLLGFLGTLFSPIYANSWFELCGKYPSRPPGIVEALAAMLRALRSTNDPAIEVSKGPNFVASYSSFQNAPFWNGVYPIQISEASAGPVSTAEKSYTISIVTAESSSETMDVLSLPKIYTWTNKFKSPGDGNSMTQKKSAFINSPVLTTSVRPQNIDQNTHYDYTIGLLIKNEYSERAHARRTDTMHWKARKVEESGMGLMEYEVKCVYWDETNVNAKTWSGERCSVLESNATYTVCRCANVGSFAVAMTYPEQDDSFWKVAGANSLEAYKNSKLILNLAGNTFSCIALVALFIYLSRKNTLRELKDHIRIKLNFGVAFIAYHLCFILFPLVEETELGCKIISILEHFFSSAALAWQSINNYFIFDALINGNLRARLKCHFFLGWMVNALIVMVVVCSTSGHDYGNGLMCLPTGTSSYIAVAESGLFLFISIVTCIINLCNVDAPAYLDPRVIEALQDDMFGSTAATAFTGVVYVLAIVLICRNPPYVAFTFWLLNSLPGCIIAVVFGLLDKSNVVRKRRSSEAVETSQILGNFVNYAHEEVAEANDESEQFGYFFDHNVEIGPENVAPPYTELNDSMLVKVEKTDRA